MLKISLSGFFIAFLMTFLAINALAEANVERGMAKYKVCVACHGQNGAGKKSNNAPKLAGQMSWYLERQLYNFKNGIRATHVDDLIGMQMRTMAIHLTTDQDIKDVVAYIETLNSETVHMGLEGNLESGKSSYAVCVSCHGANGEGNKALNAPKIAGLPDWYVERQLKNFKKGIRGVNSKDIYGQQMRPMSMTLANDAAIRNVSVYLASLSGVPQTVSADKTISEKTEKLAVNTEIEPLYATCASCHGAQGEGNKKLGAPRLAGQHPWYIERQLYNWRDGIRGTHREDLYGIQMRPMAISLVDDYAIKKVVNYISTLNGASQEPTIKGDIESGKTSYMTCAACHGVKGEGNQSLNAPRISGLPDWYIARQLHSFKKGIRGTHEKDVYGMQMRPMSMSLDDNSIDNLAAYITTFDSVITVKTVESDDVAKVTISNAKIEVDMQKGKSLYTVCASCHGTDGAGNMALNAPRIAGQKKWYVSRQLSHFKSGIRGSHEKDLYGQQMRPMSMTLKDEKAISDLSSYVNSLNGSVSSPTIDGDVAAGKISYAVCASCHGANGEGNDSLNAPAVSGLQDWYIVRQLYNFKNGIRGSHEKDLYGQQMRPMSMTLSDQAAMNNIAAYISTFK